jgi:hypothetical protein
MPAPRPIKFAFLVAATKIKRSFSSSFSSGESSLLAVFWAFSLKFRAGFSPKAAKRLEAAGSAKSATNAPTKIKVNKVSVLAPLRGLAAFYGLRLANQSR